MTKRPVSSKDKPRRRPLRLAEILRKEVSTLLQRLRDPRLQLSWITITEVDVSPDLKNARIYFSVLEKKADPIMLQQILQGAAPFLRIELSRRLEGGYGVPQLKFIHDILITNGMKMDKLIDEANARRSVE